MLLIGDSQNKGLSEGIAKVLSVPLSYPEITVFPDSEQRVRIEAEVSGKTVYLLKSIVPPVDSSVMQLSFLVDALIKNGANRVIGIIPYMPYMRADHMFRIGEGVPLEVVIDLFQDMGMSQIVIVDPHSIKIPELFSIPVHNISALPLFAKKIKELEKDKNNITIVSPDMGGLRRLQQLDELLGGVNQVIINKDRDYSSGEISVAALKGKIQGTCFIIDDIISTGKTIVQAIDALKKEGAKQVYVLGTHGVLSGDAPTLLQESKAENVFVTDSVPVSSKKNFPKLEILSIASLIASEFK